MQNNLIRQSSVVLLILAWASMSLKGIEHQQDEIRVMIDEFINAEERAKLHALPIESVEILTERLNQLNIDSPGELRVFECLSSKVEQFNSALTHKAKAAALAALKAKTNDHNSRLHSHRLQLFEAVSQHEASASSPAVTTPTTSPTVQQPSPPKTPGGIPPIN